MKEQHRKEYHTLVEKEVKYAVASFGNIQRHLGKEPGMIAEDILGVFIAIFATATVTVLLHISTLSEEKGGSPAKDTLEALLNGIKDQSLTTLETVKKEHEDL